MGNCIPRCGRRCDVGVIWCDMWCDFIGDTFALGEGIKNDELSAAQFLHQAAQAGETKAMYNLGLMYLGCFSALSASI